MDLLIPLSDSERNLVEVLLSQPEKMVSIEEALKKMEERAKKKRKTRPTTSSVTSPLANPSRQVEKERESRVGDKQKSKGPEGSPLI